MSVLCNFTTNTRRQSIHTTASSSIMGRLPKGSTDQTLSAITILQVDVVANPISVNRKGPPYLVCVQDRQLEHFARRLVAPLVTERIMAEESRLHPKCEIRGKGLYLVP